MVAHAGRPVATVAFLVPDGTGNVVAVHMIDAPAVAHVAFHGTAGVGRPRKRRTPTTWSARARRRALRGAADEQQQGKQRTPAAEQPDHDQPDVPKDWSHKRGAKLSLGTQSSVSSCFRYRTSDKPGGRWAPAKARTCCRQRWLCSCPPSARGTQCAGTDGRSSPCRP